MSVQKTESNELRKAFDYLYKTYFGELQIERDEIERLPDQLVGCEVFIDVGASLGMYTYFANKILHDAEIIAIEADTDRFEELRKNCIEWEEEGDNRIKAVRAIAGDSNKPAVFFKTGTHISGSVFAIPERSDAYQTVEVPQVMLDDFCQCGRRTVVKIDVEGAEYRVMQGASRLLQETQTKFLIAIHSWGDRERKKTPMALLRLLFSKHLAISKSRNRMTANYVFEPARCGKLALLFSYMKYAPMLFARQTYRGVMPRRAARLVERALNAARRRRFGFGCVDRDAPKSPGSTRSTVSREDRGKPSGLDGH